jgi:hypothetical protein
LDVNVKMFLYNPQEIWAKTGSNPGGKLLIKGANPFSCTENKTAAGKQCSILKRKAEKAIFLWTCDSCWYGLKVLEIPKAGYNTAENAALTHLRACWKGNTCSIQPTKKERYESDDQYDHYESYTIAPAALYEEGIANAKPASCFTGADTGPPYTRNPNGFCHKDVSGAYGTASGYNIYQNTATYDPNSNRNYGYTPGAVEQFNE